VNIFITRAGLLGVALKTGTFVIVRNSMALDIEFLGSFAANSQCKVLFEK
jgi:hypothetical protein